MAIFEFQGDPYQNSPFPRAVTQKISISDPKLVKPKCVWVAVVFLKNCKQIAEKCKQFFENWKKKPTASQTHFGFTNIGPEMHSFRVIALTKG